MEIKVIETDILIVGKGLAGLRSASRASESGMRVTVISYGESASSSITGINAPVGRDDSVDKFCEDVMRCGEINDHQLVEILCNRALSVVDIIKDVGVLFDLSENEAYDVFFTLGSSVARTLHSGSFTGIRILNGMTKRCTDNGVIFADNFYLVDIIKEEMNISALCLDLNKNEMVLIRCYSIIMASGGNGALHAFTTYPESIRGDGYAIGYRAGAELVDMEFQQYEPCTIITPAGLCGTIVTTTMLSEGGQLLNLQGEDFLSRDGYALNNLQKNELCYLMKREIDSGNGTVNGGLYFDVTQLPPKRVVVDHALFYNAALKNGIDLTKQAVEVAPAAHTCLGGIRINEKCETGINGMFAVGEVTGGLHGQGRIGGCASLECMVFGEIAADSAVEYVKSSEVVKPVNVYAIVVEQLNKLKLKIFPGNARVYNDIQEAAQKGLGIIRNKKGLLQCLKTLDEIEQSGIQLASDPSLTEIFEAVRIRNAITVLRMQALASLERNESRGVFLRSDYPAEEEPTRRFQTRIRQQSDDMRLFTQIIQIE